MEYNGLIEQFKNATGTRNIDIHSRKFLLEFSEWIRNMRNIGEDYISFINSMDLLFDTPNCAEVGKTTYDSITKPYKTKIISTVTEDFEKIDTKRIIHSNFQVINNKPLLINNKVIPRIYIDTFITQNPYTKEYINNWEQLHNSEKYNIIVGVYGNINDKDIEKKLKEIKDLKERLYEPYKEEYTIIDNTYHYVIASHRDTKKLIKSF